MEILTDKDKGARTPSARTKRQIIKLLLEQHFRPHRDKIATDYKSNLISSVKFPQDQKTYTVEYREDDQDPSEPSRKSYRVKVQFTGSLMMSTLLDYLTSTNASTMLNNEPKEEILQALNIVMGHNPKTQTDIASIGANRHFALSQGLIEKAGLGGGLEVLRGFFVSVRAATARLLVNVQVKHVACIEGNRLDRVIQAYGEENGRNTFRLEGFLKRVRVRVTHLKDKKGREARRIKTIAALASRGDGQGSPHPPRVERHGAGPENVRFFLERPGETGQYISVAEWFRRQYNITVASGIPVVNIGNKQKPSYLPADVCVVEPGQPVGSSLTPSQTQNMIKFAVRRPAQNAASIVTNGAQVLGFTPQINNTLANFGLSPVPNLITVPGRVLDGPVVYYNNNKSVTPQGANWNMKAIRFSNPARLASWAWLHIDARNSNPAQGPFQDTLKAFHAKLQELGIQAGPPVSGLRIGLSGNNDQADEAEIERAIDQLMAKKPVLLFVVLRGRDTKIYNHVKLTCDVRKGVLNVCVIANKFIKERNDQYFANVGLKINLKLGGRNQSLHDSKLGIIGEGKTMVVGIDVTHPSPGSAKNAPSVAGIVASVDRFLAQWPADIRIQQGRKEMVSDLQSMLKSRLKLWARHNKNAYPENILVYRDGVSEGQYSIVLKDELPLLKKACEELYPASDTKKGLPRISIIIVGKRHHTRFYPTKKEEADGSMNPQNGTVVDRGVTEARNWDFFLQAHTARQGTARPAHYFTVYDEIFHAKQPKAPFENTADVLEDLTHNMCYLFGRATKAVSICPPAYYADLVCERARCYLSRLFDATPQATPAGSVVEGGGVGQVPDSRDVLIHANVRDAMFYI